MNDLNIEYIPIEEIKPYENNAKIHTTEQIEQIKKSIEDFGFNDPVAIWHETIVEGHGRILAAKELGIKEIPVIRLDHLTDEERRAYMLVHNKLTMNTDFDDDILNLELEGIYSIDMEKFGFVEVAEEIIEKITEKPETKFTEVLGEEHNYVVLYFDNDVDWLQILSLLDIQEVKNLSTRIDGTVRDNMVRRGIGRVIKGNVALEKLRKHYENQH